MQLNDQIETNALNYQDIDLHIQKARVLRSQMAHELTKAAFRTVLNVILIPVKFVRQAMTNDSGAAKA